MGHDVNDSGVYYGALDYFDVCIRKTCGSRAHDVIATQDGEPITLGFVAHLVFRTIRSGIIEKDYKYLKGYVFKYHCDIVGLDHEELLLAILKKLGDEAPLREYRTAVDQLDTITEYAMSKLTNTVGSRIARRAEGQTWREIAEQDGITTAAASNSVLRFFARWCP